MCEYLIHRISEAWRGEYHYPVTWRKCQVIGNSANVRRECILREDSSFRRACRPGSVDDDGGARRIVPCLRWLKHLTMTPVQRFDGMHACARFFLGEKKSAACVGE